MVQEVAPTGLNQRSDLLEGGRVRPVGSSRKVSETGRKGYTRQLSYLLHQLLRSLSDLRGTEQDEGEG